MARAKMWNKIYEEDENDDDEHEGIKGKKKKTKEKTNRLMVNPWKGVSWIDQKI